jgi:Flp pilus assembly protein TadG
MPHLMIEHVRRRATGRGRLGADRRGAALLQFALVAPVLMLFIIGTIEIAIVLLVSGSIEASALAASRFGTTGATGAQATRLDTIKQMIADNTYGLVDMSKVQIDVEVYPSFAAIGQPEPFTDTNHNGVHDPGEAYTDVNGNGKWDSDQGSAGTGNAGDIVLYKITYQTKGITGLMQPILGTITHTATVAVRNEPY